MKSMLTFIRKTDEKYKDGTYLREYKCQCGNTIKLTPTAFRSGSYVSCGCYRKIKDRKYNTYEYNGDYVYIVDSKGNKSKIDLEDLERCKPYYWFQNNKGYFVTSTGTKHRTCIRLHNFIYNNTIPNGYEIDHKDRNKSNNTKGNLRIATRAQNNINHGLSKANSSGYVGVCFAQSGRYRAYITIEGKQIHLGVFDTIEEAYKIRLEAEKEYYGDFSSKGGDAKNEQ